MSDAVQEAHERGYIVGRRAAYAQMLRDAIRELGNSPDAAKLTVHLEETRAALRSACEELDCNDWPDSLHLADVVGKYLMPAVREAKAGEPY